MIVMCKRNCTKGEGKVDWREVSPKVWTDLRAKVNLGLQEREKYNTPPDPFVGNPIKHAKEEVLDLHLYLQKTEDLTNHLLNLLEEVIHTDGAISLLLWEEIHTTIIDARGGKEQLKDCN